jgi:membrane-associated phospholipid phosphatase
MTTPREPFVAWPGWGLIRSTLLLSLAVAVWWVLVYFGANALTGLHQRRVPVHLDAELALPFVPAFILGYLSLYFVFAPAPFILRCRRALQALALALVAITGFAGVCFLVVPAEVAYLPQDAGAWSGLVTWAQWAALRFNLVPSLHVAMSTLCLATYAGRCGTVGKLLLGGWAALIAVSTVLTHQHHLLDVLTGLALAAAGKRLVYDRLLSRPPAAQDAPASSSADPVPSA